VEREQAVTPAASTSTTRNYDRLWGREYRRARRNGLSVEMAKYVADHEVKDQRMADLGRKPFGAGDYELIY
jgi:hypothetical protein